MMPYLFHTLTATGPSFANLPVEIPLVNILAIVPAANTPIILVLLAIAFVSKALSPPVMFPWSPI